MAERIAAVSTATGRLLGELRRVALHSLAQMYVPQRRRFVFRIRRRGDTIVKEGLSDRYTAIVLIGLAEEDPDVARRVLAGDDAADVCDDLVAACADVRNLGDAALALWAARRMERPGAREALQVLRSLDPVSAPHPTVELAWALCALSLENYAVGGDAELAEALAQRLIHYFSAESSLFSHWPAGASPSRLRDHVACFADQVYPICALCWHSNRTGCTRARGVASACANRICERQGTHGQWLWHYDARTGRVIEPYPVYSVHQDAMGPMALFAASECGESDYREPIVRGLSWLAEAPEVGAGMIDEDLDIIWRKVGRREKAKAARVAQALASRAHASLRVPGIDTLLPPSAIDHESRPYHMGWILHTWTEARRRAYGDLS